MADLNEKSRSADTTAEGVAAHRSKLWRERSTAVIWRLRPPVPSTVVKTIKTQIIPKIVHALRSAPAQKIAELSPDTTLPAAEAFGELVLGRDDNAPFEHVDTLLSKGISVEKIFVDLLAPTARYLGALWDNDVTDFASVTLAVSRLQRIMRQLGDRFVSEGVQGHGGESVLLTTLPGEQHSFGLSMVAEFFRRAGWNICTGPFSSNRELTSLVHRQWFDVVGFSVSSDRRLDELKKEIEDIRRDSRNRNVGVMLGGPMLILHPNLVQSMGADSMSTDATTAPEEAHTLITRMQERN